MLSRVTFSLLAMYLLYFCLACEPAPTTYPFNVKVTGLSSGTLSVSAEKQVYNSQTRSYEYEEFSSYDFTADEDKVFSSDLYSTLYRVSITATPAGQVCTIDSAQGTSSTQGNVATTVNIVCSSSATAHSISLNVSGLASGESFALQMNQYLDQEGVGNGSTVFSQSIANGSVYSFDYTAYPAGSRCNTTGLSGTATDDVELEIVCNPVNILFNNDEKVSGAFGGRAFADQSCQESSTAALLNCSGGVVAFLSVDENDQVADYATTYEFSTDIPLYNYLDSHGRSRPIANTWQDFLERNILNSPGVEFAWAGTRYDGTFYSGYNCEGWTDESGTKSNWGSGIFDSSRYSISTNQWGFATICRKDVKYNLACLCMQNETAVTFSGTTSGLSSGTLVLGLEVAGSASSTTKSISANGAFSFSTTALSAGQTYEVVVNTQPSGLLCAVTSGATGTYSSSSDLDAVVVVCESSNYTFLSNNTVNGAFGCTPAGTTCTSSSATDEQARAYADAECLQTQEDNYPELNCLGGVAAVLTVNSTDSISNLLHSEASQALPLLNVDSSNAEIAENWTGLLGDGPLASLASSDWWAGGDANGDFVTSSDNCEKWSSAGYAMSTYTGVSGATGATWIQSTATACYETKRFLCLCYQ